MVGDYKGPKCTILVDQGADDNFLKSNQLCPENLVQAAKENESLVSVSLRMHQVSILFDIFLLRKDFELIFNILQGYDHSYYFISTFIGDHFDFHAKHLYTN